MLPSTPYVPLGEIADVKLGKMLDRSKHRSGRNLPYLRNVNVRWGRVDTADISEMFFKSEEEEERYSVRKGDVLVCEGGEPGRAAVWAREGWDLKFQKALHRVRFRDPYEPKLLVYFLEWAAGRGELEKRFTGSTIKHFTRQAFVQLPVPNPPLSEQRRIVGRIEELFSRLDAGVAALRQAKAQLKRYRQSVLAAAVTGQLTQAWRGQHPDTEPASALIARTEAPPRPNRYKTRSRAIRKGHPALSIGNPGTSLPEGWAWTHLVEIARMESGHTPSRNHPEWWDGDIPWIGIADAREHNGKVIQKTFQHTNEVGLSNSASRLLPAGTVCISRTASVGYVTVMGRNMATSQDFVNWIPTKAVTSDWIRVVFQADTEALRGFGSGSVHKTIYFPEWLSMHVALPPLAEQHRIVAEVEARTAAINHLEADLDRKLTRSNHLRQSILSSAFGGTLIEQDSKDEPAAPLLERIKADLKMTDQAKKFPRKTTISPPTRDSKMKSKVSPISPDIVASAWIETAKKTDALSLFNAVGALPTQVVEFYEALRNSPTVLNAFRGKFTRPKTAKKRKPSPEKPPAGRFRLVELWLEDFKNLKNYTVQFGPSFGFDVILGWNGTGKSNLFEALVVILRDLHYWKEKNQWPDQPMAAYSLTYEINEQRVSIEWKPSNTKRPRVAVVPTPTPNEESESPQVIKRQDLQLPKFVFGYYSGPTNRLAEHFFRMKRDHYEALRDASSDDPETITELLAQRRFFCAESSHAKYVLLAFAYKQDARINRFLEERLRIVGFESALFIIRKPRWARNADPKDFWGAKGVMRMVMEKLRQYAIAPMVMRQLVSDGYQTSEEEHYYFFLPDLKSLHAFAAEYADAPSFFVALESTDFSELVHDVRIQVSIKDSAEGNSPVTFRELSEGEQQLLMVLGLMRFTKSHQSLILLDEPDTHLNPHWSVEYLKDLASVMSDSDDVAPEQQTSQLLMATHDPLVIASLVREQIHLLKRDSESLECGWSPSNVTPRGLGFTGILTSDIFGFRSDLDPETLADLDDRVRLVAKKRLSKPEKKRLEEIDLRMESAGFSTAHSDPYFAAFARAWGRRHSELMAGKQFLSGKERKEIDRIAQKVLEEAMSEVENEES